MWVRIITEFVTHRRRSNGYTNMIKTDLPQKGKKPFCFFYINSSSCLVCTFPICIQSQAVQFVVVFEVKYVVWNNRRVVLVYLELSRESPSFRSPPMHHWNPQNTFYSSGSIIRFEDWMLLGQPFQNLANAIGRKLKRTFQELDNRENTHCLKVIMATRSPPLR